MNLKTYWRGHDNLLHSAAIDNIGDVQLAINLTKETLEGNNEMWRKPILASVPCGKQPVTISETLDNDPTFA